MGLQQLTHLGKQGSNQFVALEQMAKLQQRGGIGYALAAQVDATASRKAGTS
jgi:hypothetical protein